MIWTEVPLDGHTYLYVFPRGGVMAARHRSDIVETIVRPRARANGDAFILMQGRPDMTCLTCVPLIILSSVYIFIDIYI